MWQVRSGWLADVTSRPPVCLPTCLPALTCLHICTSLKPDACLPVPSRPFLASAYPSYDSPFLSLVCILPFLFLASVHPPYPSHFLFLLPLTEDPRRCST